MLCTNCSEPIRPIVALDIDGTLGDYHGHFLNFADMWFDHPADTPVVVQYTGEEPFGEWFCNTYKCDMTTFRQCKLAYRQGGLKRSMPVREGAQQLVDDFVDQSIELWICTTRPYLRLDNIDPDTRFWLDRNFGAHHFTGLLYDESKYQQLYERVDSDRVLACLDDLPEMVDQADSFFPGAGMLIDNPPYNDDAFPAGISYTLSLAQKTVIDRLASWMTLHA